MIYTGEEAGLRKPKLFRGTRATGLTSVPETPPGCQVDLFFKVESLQTKTYIFRNLLQVVLVTLKPVDLYYFISQEC